MPNWLAWLNGWVFVYKLSGCGFKSCSNHLNFRSCACFKQGIPWHSGNYRVWIHSKTSTWLTLQSYSFWRHSVLWNRMKSFPELNIPNNIVQLTIVSLFSPTRPGYWFKCFDCFQTVFHMKLLLQTWVDVGSKFYQPLLITMQKIAKN